jgi:hypothetical protein
LCNSQFAQFTLLSLRRRRPEGCRMCITYTAILPPSATFGS